MTTFDDHVDAQWASFNRCETCWQDNSDCTCCQHPNAVENCGIADGDVYVKWMECPTCGDWWDTEEDTA